MRCAPLLLDTRCARGPVAVAILLAATSGAASAAESRGCSAANHGALNATLEAGEATRQTTALEPGESLTFVVETEGAVSIELESEAQDTVILHRGGATGGASFSATDRQTYGFRYSAQDAPARVLVTCRSGAAAEAQRSFLARRSAMLTGQQPERMKIDRAASPAVAVKAADPAQVPIEDIGKPRETVASVSMSELIAKATPGVAPDPGVVDLWMEGRIQPYEAMDAATGESYGNVSAMYVGSSYKLGSDILVGALAQLDTSEQDSRGGTSMSASGHMAGPFASVRFGPGVVLDSRVAWGAYDDATGSGSVVDRRLARGTLRGTRDYAGWTFSPSVSLSYLEDQAETQGPTTSAPPSGQGRIDVLPEAKRRFALDGRTFIEPRAAVGGFATFDRLDAAALAGTAVDPASLHLKAEAGVAVGVTEGMSLSAAGGVEAAAQAATADAWTGRLQLNVPLGK